MSVEELAKNPVEQPEEDLNAIFGKKKSKKSSKSAAVAAEALAADTVVIDGTGKEWVPGVLYGYDDLLSRIQQILQRANPDLGARKKFTIKPPIVQRAGTKKVAWTNFQEVCKALDRSQDHVLQFVLSEFGTEGSISGENHLILKGKIEQKHIESLLRKYIKEYVTCKMCNSPNTKIDRDPTTRLHIIRCAACGAHRSVASIKGGFHAVSRADRIKAKAAA